MQPKIKTLSLLFNYSLVTPNLHEFDLYMKTLFKTLDTVDFPYMEERKKKPQYMHTR